jgi:hypothetical protein
MNLSGSGEKARRGGKDETEDRTGNRNMTYNKKPLSRKTLIQDRCQIVNISREELCTSAEGKSFLISPFCRRGL